MSPERIIERTESIIRTMDPLSPLFAQFALSARVFYTGHLCGTSGDHDSPQTGYLHVVRSGKLKVVQPQGADLTIAEPTVLFYPRPARHRFITDRKLGADIVCATVEFGVGITNPLLRVLPALVLVKLQKVPELETTSDLLFSEAFNEQPGRQVAVDRLAEYFLILLLRAAITQRLVNSGILPAMADPRLAPAVLAIHHCPQQEWSLKELSRLAGMSRARFAAHFREVVGSTPFDYLTDWRIGLAQSLLKRGQPLKLVAPEVGFHSSAGLSRAFSRRIGLPPSLWVAKGSDAQVSNSAAD